MEISLTEITAWVGDFFWPFLRVAAVLLASPIFGARTVPIRVRMVLAVVLTLIIQPSLPFLETIEPLSGPGILLIVEQLAIGIIMGIILQIMFATLVMAGQTMATTMGLGFASAADPQNGVQVTMVGQFYLIVGTLFFLAMDGHLLLIQMMVDSFIAIPVNSNVFSMDIFWNITLFSAEMFAAAIIISLPVIVGVLLVNLGFGVMTRAAPQLNIFAVGFPTTMLAGFVLMLLSLPILFPLLSDLFSSSFDFMKFLVN